MSFSVIANLTTSAGSPASTQNYNFENSMRQMFENTSLLGKYAIPERRPTAAGEDGAIFSLRSRANADSATKAPGATFAEGTAGTHQITTTYEKPEGLEQNYDWTQAMDARFNTMSIDAANQLLVETELRDKRVLHLMSATQRLSAITGYTKAPGNVTHSGVGSIAAYFTLDNTGAERVVADMVDLKTDMMNSNRRKGPNWLAIMRHSVFNPLLFGNRTTSAEFKAGSDLNFGVRPFLLDIPIIVVNDDYWPSESVAYVDKSFSKYNFDGTNGGSNGAPAFFLVNFGNGVSPICETIPPSMAGINVRAYSDERREVDTVLVKARYATGSFDRGAIGAARCGNSIT